MVTATSGGVQHEHREDATGARDNGMIRDGLIAQLALDRFEKRWVASARYVPLSDLEFTSFPTTRTRTT